MKNQNIDSLLLVAGASFSDDQRHNINYENFSPCKFAELILTEGFDSVIQDGRFHDARRIIKAAKSVAVENFGFGIDDE